jgi:2,3-bisphosphoglycerate-independent phosphoglycerate mutase
MSIQKKVPTVLVILDGWGIAPPSRGNAITLAKTPTLDEFYKTYPSTTLGATGQDVGLEDHKMSGSETGHMNIGAGRVVLQDSFYITESIKNGSFFVNPALTGAINHAKEFGGNVHVMGLMGNSDSPHSDPEHFKAILKLAKNSGLEEVYCHLFTDGRDSYPKSALDHLKYFKEIIAKIGIGKIATLSGRFYAMDRAKNWRRLTRAYDAIVFSRGEIAQTPEEAIEKNYEKTLTDEYLNPTVILSGGKPIAKLQKNDSVIFFNFRSDRARQFTKLFVANNKESIVKDNMPVLDKIKNLYFVAMTDFGPDLDIHTAFPEQNIAATLPMVLGKFKQLYIAESEKYAHVTYFLNGGYAEPVGGEKRMMINSPAVDSYAKIPEMSAGLLTQNVISYVKNNIYDFITMNYANADMVGHTGDLKATVKAIEFIDKQLALLCKEVLKKKGNIIITADHGNADDMLDFDSNQPNTFHTKNPVPLIIVSDKYKDRKLEDGGVLGNLAPTLLEVIGVEKPTIMVKNSLLR